jgi:trigger factor
MNVSRETKSTANDILLIELTPEDYKQGFESKLKKYSKEMTVPGFRKGMVPVGMIRKLHGQAILAEEINNLADKALNDFVKENSIKLLGNPILADDQAELELKPTEDKSYQLKFEIGYEPNFSINLAGNVYHKCEIDVTKEMVDKEIENVFAHFTKLEDSADPIEEGDTFYFDLNNANEIKADSFASTEELTEAGKTQFLGKKVGDSFEMKLSDAINNEKLNIKKYVLNLKDESTMSDEEFNGPFTVSLTNVKKKVKPAELTSEQVQQITRDESKTTTEELRIALEDDIKKQYDNLATNFLRNDVYEYVSTNTAIDLPTNFLKKWLVSDKQNNITEDAIDKDYINIEKSIKWDLITSKFALENGIKVEIEDVKNEFRNRYLGYFANSGYNPPADQLDKFVEDAMKDQNSVRKTFESVLDVKVLDKMIEGIQTKAIKYSEEQFVAESKSRSEKHNQKHIHDENCGDDCGHDH